MEPRGILSLAVYLTVFSELVVCQSRANVRISSVCVQDKTCLLPDCRCSRTREPIFSGDKVAPQIVALVFEGTVDRTNFDQIRNIFGGRKHLNGKAMSGTLFVNAFETNFTLVEKLHREDRFEIGLYGASAAPVTSFAGRTVVKPSTWRSQLREHRREVAERASVSLGDIRGFRNNLPVTEEFMYEALQAEGFEYDSSGKIQGGALPGRVNQWPFSLHYGWGQTCYDSQCPTGNYSKLWEIPQVYLYNSRNSYQCAYINKCVGINSVPLMTRALADNFASAYRGARPPLVITAKLKHVVSLDVFAPLAMLVRGLTDRHDIFLVTLSDLLAWVRHPTPLAHIDALPHWKHQSARPSGESVRYPVVHAQDGFPRPPKPIATIPASPTEDPKLRERVRLLALRRIMDDILVLRRKLVELPATASGREYDALLNQIHTARKALERISSIPHTVSDPITTPSPLRTIDALKTELTSARLELANARDAASLKTAVEKYKALVSKVKAERVRHDSRKTTASTTPTTSKYRTPEEQHRIMKLKLDAARRVLYNTRTNAGYDPKAFRDYKAALREESEAKRVYLKSKTSTISVTKGASTGGNWKLTTTSAPPSVDVTDLVSPEEISRLIRMLRMAKGNTSKLTRLRSLVAELVSRFKSQQRQRLKSSRVRFNAVPDLNKNSPELILASPNPTAEASGRVNTGNAFVLPLNNKRPVKSTPIFLPAIHLPPVTQQLKERLANIDRKISQLAPLKKVNRHTKSTPPKTTFDTGKIKGPSGTPTSQQDVDTQIEAILSQIKDPRSRQRQYASSLDNTAWLYGAPYSRKDAPRLPILTDQSKACVGCCLPFCRDMNAGPPGNLKTAEIPQLLVFMFDGKLDLTLYDALRRISQPKLNNPNGCAISMTYFASGLTENYDLIKRLYDRGMEIGVNTVTSTGGNRAFWANIQAADLRDEITRMQRNIAQRSRVPMDEIVGFRMPHVHPVGDVQYRILKSAGFLYDSSLMVRKTSLETGGHWPFTLDNGWPLQCELEPCPNGRYPGLWEIPVVSMINDPAPNPLKAVDGIKSRRAHCSFVDSCNPADLRAYLLSNFVSHYKGSREPLYLNFHGGWLKQERYVTVLRKFIREMLDMRNVYIVSAKQTIDWVKAPKSIDQIKLSTWGC